MCLPSPRSRRRSGVDAIAKGPPLPWPSIRSRDHLRLVLVYAVDETARSRDEMPLGFVLLGVLLDTYSHAFPALSEQLTEGLDAAYRDSLTAQIRHEDGTRVTSLDAKRVESTG